MNFECNRHVKTRADTLPKRANNVHFLTFLCFQLLLLQSWFSIYELDTLTLKQGFFFNLMNKQDKYKGMECI